MNNVTEIPKEISLSLIKGSRYFLWYIKGSINSYFLDRHLSVSFLSSLCRLKRISDVMTLRLFLAQIYVYGFTDKGITFKGSCSPKKQGALR